MESCVRILHSFIKLTTEYIYSLCVDVFFVDGNQGNGEVMCWYYDDNIYVCLQIG